MRLTRTTRFVSLLAPLIAALAQNADPSGHWEGKVQAEDREVKIEIDIARNVKGDFAGTFGQPAQGVKGLPLSTAAVEGRSVRLIVKADVQPATFQGTLATDGQSISGNLTQAGYTLPFNLTRTGEARITPAPKSAAIGKELEGTWNGTLEAAGRQMRLILKMANQPGGTSTGSVVSPDGSGIEIPVGMTQKGKNLTVAAPSIGASFSAVLNDDETELTGTWNQGPVSQPLTLRHAAK